jgi:predicted DCC family thiol-disulfide oxidoreductase YuxK
MSSKHPVVFYDGVCGFCSASIMLYLKLDVKHQLRFVSLQSKYAYEFLSKFGLAHLTKDINTSLLVMPNGVVYSQLDASLETLKILGCPYSVVGHVGLLLPRFVRDYVYGVLARNRYLIMGRKDKCIVPDPCKLLMWMFDSFADMFLYLQLSKSGF